MTVLAVSTFGWGVIAFVVGFVWMFAAVVMWGLMVDTAKRERAAREAYERMQAERTNAVPQAEERPS